MDGTARTLSYHYDAASNRTRITHPDGNWFGTLYDVASRPYYLDANGSAGIAYASYYSHGGLSTLQRLGAASGFAWDAVLRPASRSHYFAGTTGNGGWSYAYNPAGQLSLIQRDDPYAESSANANVASTANGLNQIVQAGSATLSYDADGNLASDGTRNFAYDIENRMVSATGQPTSALSYDPLGRLFEVSSVNGTTRFLYDGHTLVGEYNTSGTLLRRHVHWPGVDVPTATYEGADLSTIRQLFSNHLGSVVALADGNGANIAINRYDEYGVPQGGALTGRFGYTGQMWLPEVGMYYYRARIYDPNGGRFPQFDPSGYADGMNGYNYAGGDPVNRTDPLGLGNWPTRVEYKRNNDGTVGVGLNTGISSTVGGLTGAVSLGGTLYKVTPAPKDRATGQTTFGESIFKYGMPSGFSLFGGSAGWGSAPSLLPGNRPSEICIGDECNNPVVTASHRPRRNPSTGLPEGYLPYPNSNGRLMYREDDPSRVPIFTPWRQREICYAYDRMMESNTEVGAVATGGGILGSLNGSLPLVILNTIVGVVTTALGLSSPPPGCSS